VALTIGKERNALREQMRAALEKGDGCNGSGVRARTLWTYG